MTERKSGGVFRRARALLFSVGALRISFAELLRARFELLLLAARTETTRLVHVLLLALLLTCFLGLALTMASLFVVALCWESCRLQAIGGVALFHLLVAVIAGLLLRRELRRAGRPFADTLSVLRKDYERLTLRS
jgi:uncharacterized membrane protein YqjE